MPAIEESLILKALINNNDYFLLCMPRIEVKLFSEKPTRFIFKCIQLYYEKYNKQPTPAVLDLFAEKVTGITEDQHKTIIEICEYIKKPEEINFDWIRDKTLEWIRERRFYEALIEGAEKFDKGELDTTLSEKLDAALSVTFDNTIGMEFADAESRWEKYTSVEEHIPFDLEIFNTITNGGVCRGTLNVFMSTDTGGFKSGTMCHIAAGALRAGKNVLYISFEMAEDKIMERIDANMLDIEIENLVKLGKDAFLDRVAKLVQKGQGRCIAKQFPTSQCHVGHIRYLLKELKQKRSFVPDLICLDYLNIMASSRLKAGEAGNSYGYIKAISEEVRGLAIEMNVPIFSATQSNRGGSGNEELSVTDISESYGLVFGCDILIGIITTPEFDAQNKICFKQLKNRYRDINMNNKFLLGVNKSKMKLYDLSTYTANPNADGKAELESEADEFTSSVLKIKRKKISL